MLVYRSLLLLALAAASAPAGNAFAQGGPPPFPSDGAVPEPSSEACTNDFASLRRDTEARGRLIKAAADRHAPPAEACTLINSYNQAEIKMIKFVEANAARCAIPLQIAVQLKTGHTNTETLLRKVCAKAEQAAARPAGQVGDFDHLINRQIP
ncbi:hypothetical protein FBZ93_105290 [Bradyrhizobium macuxiense]|uniref:Uncharacterized protein n=1 Tax=Bradyrhizobium macuxiense TaxID=1755647 RepID=A0A560LYK0_9BRAD|nr:hypothetical protein FBZ93_105290 [Bradyrhizobium macuxiense]